MCRASEAFKTAVLKNANEKILTKNSNLMVKNENNVGLKNLNFEFLVNGVGLKLKNKPPIFFIQFFFITKDTMVFGGSEIWLKNLEKFCTKTCQFIRKKCDKSGPQLIRIVPL